MLRRAKISALFTLVGALTATGALFNPEQRHPAFQPNGNTGLSKVDILKPAQVAIPGRHWAGTKGQRINASAPATIKVGLTGSPFTRTAEAPMAPVAVRKAGGAR